MASGETTGGKTPNCEQRWQEHWKRWNIQAPPFDLVGLRNRLVQGLEKALGAYQWFLEDIIRNYDSIRGLSPTDVPKQVSESVVIVYFKKTSLAQHLLGASTLEDWVDAVQCLLWSAEASCSIDAISRAFTLGRDRATHLATTIMSNVCSAVRDAIELSPACPVAIHIDATRAYLYPRGAKLLDEGIVNADLNWLSSHKAAAEHFQKALQFDLTGNAQNYRNLLDELRKALEELCRDVLSNPKSLENQGPLLLPWLKSHGIHQQVINMFNDLVAKFVLYQNDAVKHGDRWSVTEVEFMIYLTGTFMRMLLQLEKGQ